MLYEVITILEGEIPNEFQAAYEYMINYAKKIGITITK